MLQSESHLDKLQVSYTLIDYEEYLVLLLCLHKIVLNEEKVETH